MIISNNIQNPKMYLGNSDVLRIYQGLNMIYEQSSPVIEPCFEVVNLISSASGDYIDVYELSTSKWYKRNNLNAYEEYGVMESVQSLQNATYYTGKLVILSTDNHEYKWNGNAWSDLGLVGDSYEFYEDFVVNSSYNDTTHYFDTGYDLNNNITKVWAKYYAARHSNDFMLASIQGSAESPTWKGASIQYFGSLNYIGYNWRYGTDTEGGTNYWISYTGGTDVEVEINRENNTVTCNGNTRTHTNEIQIGTGYTVKVFQHPNASSSKAINSGDKFYGYKIWESGELAVDLVPAKRVGDEAIGMYDKERGIFIAPHATTSMTLENKTGGKEGIPESYQTKVAPADNVHYNTLAELELMECPWVGMRATIGEGNTPYEYTENGWIEQEPEEGLPEGYTQYDYIEQTSTSRHGECRIDLDYYPKGTDELGFIWDVPYSQHSSGYIYVYGCKDCEFMIKLDSGFQYGMLISTPKGNLVNNRTMNAIKYPCFNEKAWFNTSRYGIKYKYSESDEWTEISKNTFVNNGVTLPISGDWVLENNASIFSVKDTTGSYYAAAMKLYRFTIMDADTQEVSHDFVPATNPSGNKGLYDLITDTWCPCSNDSYFTMGQAV